MVSQPPAAPGPAIDRSGTKGKWPFRLVVHSFRKIVPLINNGTGLFNSSIILSYIYPRCRCSYRQWHYMSIPICTFNALLWSRQFLLHSFRIPGAPFLEILDDPLVVTAYKHLKAYQRLSHGPLGPHCR